MEASKSSVWVGIGLGVRALWFILFPSIFQFTNHDLAVLYKHKSYRANTLKLPLILVSPIKVSLLDIRCR